MREEGDRQAQVDQRLEELRLAQGVTRLSHVRLDLLLGLELKLSMDPLAGVDANQFR